DDRYRNASAEPDPIALGDTEPSTRRAHAGPAEVPDRGSIRPAPVLRPGLLPRCARRRAGARARTFAGNPEGRADVQRDSGSPRDHARRLIHKRPGARVLPRLEDAERSASRSGERPLYLPRGLRPSATGKP